MGASGADIQNDATASAYYSWYNGAAGNAISTQPTAPNVNTAYAAGNLLALADNGGKTQTMALGAGAPAIGAGTFAYYNSGATGYYLQANDNSWHQLSNWANTPANNAAEKLTTDQRGATRSTPTAIGAFDGTVTFSISGTVTQGGAAKQGVTVSDGTRTATTDASGNYTITGVPNGNYTVTPTLAGGYSFTPANSAVTVSGANQTGKNFAVTMVNLTMAVSGTGTTSPAAGVTSVPAGVAQAITATAGDGNTFGSWSGTSGSPQLADTGSANTNVTLTADATVTANFNPSTSRLTVLVSPSSLGDPRMLVRTLFPPDMEIPYGLMMPLMARSAPGATFLRWESNNPATVIDMPTSPYTSVRVNGTTTITAVYAAQTLVLSVTSGSGAGTYSQGQLVPIEAGLPPTGSMFDKWTGDTAGIADVNKAATTITMPNANASIQATFKPIPAVQYTCTVTGGAGGGSFKAGDPVSIMANIAPDGQIFDKWTGDVTGVADVNSANTTLTMPAADVTVTATYKVLPPTLYQLTVQEGTGGGNFKSGTLVTIQAGVATDGQAFDRWDGPNGAFANAADPNTTLTMPAANATVTALFKILPPVLYPLTVLNGTGSGTYKAGTSVTVMANLPPDGFKFDKWVGQTSGIANINDANTSVTMPTASITVQATYREIPVPQYSLNVYGGTGSGSYKAGTRITLMADQAPNGQMFDRWVGQVSTIGNVNDANTSLIMPAGDITVKATYKDKPIPTYALVVTNGVGSGTFKAGTVVNIMAKLAPDGQMFDKWVGQVANVANVNAPNTSLTMPGEAIEVKATFKDIPPASYTLTIASGSGGGLYQAGTVVAIVAGLPATGTMFDQWTGQTAQIANVTAANTTVTMPPASITIKALFKPVPVTKYTLTVTGGTGTGEYEAGTSVSIMADTAQTGQRFYAWSGQTSYVANVTAANTTVTMPSSNLNIMADFTIVPARKFRLTVYGGSGSGEYAPGEIVTIQSLSPFMNFGPYPYSSQYPYSYDYQSSMNYPYIYSSTMYGMFAGWRGQINTVQDPWRPVTTLIMPDFDIEVYAKWYPGLTGFGQNEQQQPKQYTLTVQGGTGGGKYSQATSVKIMANPPAEGKVFDRWSGQTQGVANLFAANTEVSMPGFDQTMIATYKDLPLTTYRLTVASGTGSGDYQVGKQIALVASLPADGKMFDQWIGQTTNVANPLDANTTLTMPAASISVAATYKDIPVTLYPLGVASGTGSGQYKAGSTVSVMAQVAPDGFTFDQWIGQTSYIDNVLSANTTLTMPAASATIRATYKPVPVTLHTLTVASGTGAGQYKAGTMVPLMAKPPAEGMMFDQWTGQNSTIDNVNSPNTVLTMPDGSIEVRATYRTVAVASYALAVASGTGSGNYKAGTVVGVGANLPASGFVFDLWTGQTAAMANVAAPNTTLSMPAGDTGVRATYRVASTTLYTLTVASGTGSGKFPSGTAVTLTAKPPQAGLVFDKWIGQTSYVANVLLPTTTLLMPAADIEVRASYASAVTQVYTLTVSGGSGSGNHALAAVVPVQAQAPAAGMMFDKWTGQTSYLADVGQASTTLTMPAANIEIRATYRAVPAGTFHLTVGDGSGTGDYAAATVVSIVATQPPSGKVFDRWLGQTANVADILASATTLTMPAADTEVRASFVTPSPAILVQPVARSVAAGDNASFTVTATRAATLQWQVNMGAGFVDVIDNSVYSGATTQTLTITGVTTAMNGYVFRCIAGAPQLVNAESEGVALSVFVAVFADNTGKKYASWADAIAGVANRGTLTLLIDHQFAADAVVTKSITLNLNGKSLGGNVTFVVAEPEQFTLANTGQQGAFDNFVMFSGVHSILSIASSNVFNQVFFRNDGSLRFKGVVKGTLEFGDGVTPISYTVKTSLNGISVTRDVLKQIRIRDKANVTFTR